eukprot:Em0039g5a
MAAELSISNKTSIDWYNFIRDVCAQYFIDHPAVIGGPGIEEREKKLRDAASNGNLEEVIELLKKGTKIEATDEEYPRACVIFPSPPPVGALVSATDHKPDARDMAVRSMSLSCEVIVESQPELFHQDGWTPLMWASSKGHITCVQLLLKKGAQVDYQANDAGTPLILASMKGHAECMQLLLEKGAQVNHQDKDGWTPLRCAVSGGHVTGLQLLLDSKAQVNHHDKLRQFLLFHHPRKFCERGGDVVARHNHLRDIFGDFCYHAHLSVKIEVGYGLSRDNANSSSADGLAQVWYRGKPTVFDVTVTSSLTPVTLSEASVAVGAAAFAAESRKHAANDAKCQELGWSCIPLAIETYGNWKKEAQSVSPA